MSTIDIADAVRANAIALLMALGSSDDHEQFIKQHLDEFDETFFSVLSATIEQSEESGETRFAGLLRALGALIVRKLMTREHPEAEQALDATVNLMRLLAAESPEQVQAVVTENPSLASEGALAALQELKQHAIEASDNDGVTRISRVISWLDELRNSPQSPVSLIQTISEFVQAQTWAESKVVLDSHPELLTDVAATLLDQVIKKAERQKDDNAVKILTEHRDLIRECRELGTDAAFERKLVAPVLQSLVRTIFDFVLTDTWDQSRLIVVEHPELLTEIADDVLGGMIEFARQRPNQEELVRVFGDHRELLAMCRKEGIDVAFAKQHASHISRLDFDAAALLRLVSPEQLRTALETTIVDSDIGEEKPSSFYFSLGVMSERQNSVDQAREFFMKALVVAEKTSDSHIQVMSLVKLGELSMNQGEHQMPERLFTRALRIAETQGNQEGLATACAKLGFVYHTSGDYDRALGVYRKGVLAAQSIEDEDRLAELYDYMGMIHRRQQDFEKAIRSHKMSIELYEKLGRIRDVGVARSNLGAVYSATEQYQLAIEHFEKAAEIVIGLGDRRGYALVIDNIAAVHSQQGNYPEALKLHKESADILLELGDEREAAIVYNNLGTTYLRMNNHSAATVQLEKSLKITNHLGDKPRAAQMHTNLGELYRELRMYEQSANHYRKARDLWMLLGRRDMWQAVTVRLQLVEGR